MWSKQGATKRNARAGPCSWRTHAVSTPVPSSCTSSNQLGCIPSLQGIFQERRRTRFEQAVRSKGVQGSWAGSMPATPRRCRKCASRSSNTACSSWGSKRRYGAKACTLIHAHAPRRYTSTHTTATPAGMEEAATEGGGLKKSDQSTSPPRSDSTRVEGLKHRGRDVHPDATLGFVRGRADVWRSAEARVFNQRMTCANRLFFEHVEGQARERPVAQRLGCS